MADHSETEHDALDWSWECPGCHWSTRDTRMEGHICPPSTRPVISDGGGDRG